MRKRFGACALIACLLLVTFAREANGKGEREAREADLKAIFLFHFTRFVEWPSSAFVGGEDPLTIGILGEDPFGKILDDIVAGETIDGHPIHVKRFQRVEEVGDCHVLFISPSEVPRFGDILAVVGERSILTVSDADGFTERSGMIRFIVSERLLRLQINLKAAQGAGLVISSKLLRQSDIVESQRSS